MKVKNWPVFLSVCMAFGGIGNVIVMCFMIGFGFHTFVGKEALYIAFALQGISLLVSAQSERRHAHGKVRHQPSKKMRRFRQISFAIWALGAMGLIISLLLCLLGTRYTNEWVRISCVGGAIVSPIGWLGLLMASHRRQTALRCREEELQTATVH